MPEIRKPVDIEPVFKQGVLAGRNAVDTYRQAHTALHSKGWYPEIHADHTPLLDTALDAFKELGFNSLQEFFDASFLLNIRGLGFVDEEDFEANASSESIQTLGEMWY